DQRRAAVLSQRHGPGRVRTLAVAAALLALAMPARAAEPVALYAAGSLRPALSEVAAAFERATGVAVTRKFGASGLLKDEILAGAPAQVFASANMEHPRALAAAGRASPAVLFARNRLCVLARPGLAIATSRVLDVLLDPTVRVATSTPKADP